MGGYGSGYRYRLGTKHTTNSFYSLDVRWLARHKFLRPGMRSLSFSRNGTVESSISISIQHEGAPRPTYLHLVYTNYADGQRREVADPIEIEWTRCTYGGYRPWFLCPGAGFGIGCSRRVALLYLSHGYFRCRHCLELVYTSQRTGLGQRQLAKAQAIRERLGGSANMTLPFPPKPPQMHWRTYWRLRREADNAEDRYSVDLFAWLDRTDAELARRFPEISTHLHE